MAKIRWKTVPEAPQYQVSNTGVVRHKKMKRPRTLVLLNGVASVSVQVKVEGKPKTKTLMVARLVGRHFVDGYRKNLWATVKNGDPLDCRAANIVWTDRATNAEIRKSREAQASTSSRNTRQKK